MPRLIFNAKTMKLCSKIKSATQAQQTAPSRYAVECSQWCPSWGQKLKSSMGAYVFRSAPNNGHRATTAACPSWANTGNS